MFFECKIEPLLLEQSLKIALKENPFIPTSFESLNLFLMKAFKKLEEEIFLLSPEILENFTLIGETKMGELRLKSMKEKLEAVETGFLSLSDLRENAINAIIAECDLTPILEDENLIFVSKNESTVKKFKPSFSEIKLGEFIALRQEFFTRLKSFSIIEESFLKKVLRLLEPSISAKDFLELFENQKGVVNLITFYSAMFFVIEGLGAVKKKWIF